MLSILSKRLCTSKCTSLQNPNHIQQDKVYGRGNFFLQPYLVTSNTQSYTCSTPFQFFEYKMNLSKCFFCQLRSWPLKYLFWGLAWPLVFVSFHGCLPWDAFVGLPALQRLHCPVSAIQQQPSSRDVSQSYGCSSLADPAWIRVKWACCSIPILKVTKRCCASGVLRCGKQGRNEMNYLCELFFQI